MIVLSITSGFVLAASGLKIGVAKVKITPEEPTILGGYSHGIDARCNPITDILDDIYCRIMVAEDGSGNRELFLSMDVCVYMESDYYDPANGIGVWWPKTVPTGTTQRFADAGGVLLNRVFVSATHTHQASEQLADKYIQRIMDGINMAKNNMVTVNMGYVNTTYDLNVNRRPDFGVHPDLECDKSLVVAIFRNASTNTPVASIVNYAIHNTGIGTGGGRINKCSSELTGIAMNKIESNYGGGFVSLFFQGFEGDIGPCFDGVRGAVYSTVVSTGNTFGLDCTNILNGINVSSNPVSVNGIISSQTLATKSGWGVATQGVNFAAARIGDIGFVGGSGEIFNQMGVSLRLQSPFGAVVTAALVNGYCGYVPTLSGFKDGVGGAEVTSKCPWTSNIENIYMTEMSKLTSSLIGGSSTLGYSSVGGKSESSSSNVLTVSKCITGSSMTISSLKIYVQNASGKVRLGLYADNGTDSPILLQQTGEIPLVNGWNEGAITTTNIEPGTYWLGFVFSNIGNTIYYDLRKLGSYSQSYPFGPLPSNPTGMSWGKGMYSIYAGTGGTTAPVASVSLNPVAANIYVSGNIQLTSTVSPSNAAIKSVTWSSDNTSVASVSNNGLVTGVAAGTATITVTTQDGGKTAVTIINVITPVLVTGVSLNSSSLTISINNTVQLIATVSPSNATNKTVSWSSDNTSVAIVNSSGLIEGVSAGSAIITVTTQEGSKTATCAVTVTAGDTSIIGLNAIGGNQEKGDNGFWIANSFTAVSNITVNRMNVYVSNAAGNARLGIYSDNSGQPGALLSQTDEIILANGWNSGMLGTTLNLVAGITYWLAIEVSSSATTLFYNNAAGRLRYKAYAYGSLPSPAPLNCSVGSGIYSLYADNSGAAPVPVTGVAISPASSSIIESATQQFTASVLPANATNKNVSWSSNNTAVATVNSTGLVSGISAGSATITVTTQDGGKTATSTVIVGGDGSVLGLNIVGSISEKGDNGFWIASSFTAVSSITVNRMNIYVSNAAGNARLGIYSDNSGQPGVLLAQTDEIILSNGWNSSLLASPQNITSGSTYWLAIEVNSSATTLYYNDAAGRLRYKSYTYGLLPSSAPTGLTSGSGIYSLYADNNGILVIPVTGVTVSPTSASISVNATQQLTATVLPSDATNKTVTWSSANTSVATVSSSGLVTGVAAGNTTVTVTTQDGNKTAVSTLTVNPAPVPVTGVTVSPTSAGISVNATQQLTATVLPSDATNKTVTWSSANTSVATVSSSGLVTGVAAGNTTVTVTTQDGNKTAVSTLTVNPAPVPVTGVTVSPTSASISVNATQQLTATVLPSDATNKTVTWSSANTSVATVSSTGLVTGVAAGTATVTVTTQDGNKTAVCTLTVNPAPVPVTGVTVSPTSASISVNATQQLTATVLPSNATNKTVTWSSGKTSVATVNSSGLVTGIAAGTATIKATTQDGGKTASCSITVNSLTGTVGLNTVGSISETGDNGLWMASSFAAVSNMTVNRMNLYVSSASGKARLGIYSSRFGQPSSLLAQTGEITLSNGWNSAALVSSKNLTSGVTYWLAIEVTSSATTLYHNNATGRQRYKSYAYGPLPNSAPTGLTSGTSIYSVYADYSSVIALAAGVVPSIALDTIAAQTLKSAEADQKNREINPITRRQNQLMIFPNPNNNGTLYVKLGSADESTSLNIIDLTGRVIYSKMLINIDGTQQLDIGKLKRGIYIVNIAQGNVIYNCKLIVE